ncbi:cell surface protein [Clostridium carboxidivorans P7]|uniref:Ig domain protein n=1 Tax=Clostridium carboxidivorans P7 TaxID=536227 RepID=C6PPG1_9CLOT|nr:cell wall-binding repeat-containing protein [Clostridium carboxidivorans]AKN33941.1 cell surface protein [Clostridium carboxidivorans P7]EET88855.1 Ig domain protein [Clostridium carboxidivorans P7]EFG88185.1 bacterial Ig-like domain (group 4) [Clostridium carboxidivorans P7]
MKSKRLTFIVAVLVAGLCFSAFKVKAETITTRYNGIDRYETAAKVCQDGWKSSQNVVIVNGENFPDALAAAPLAKKNDAPILLTSKDVLNPYTSVEINRLGVKNAFIIGGRGVVSQAIEDSLKSRGIKVTRLGGVDRYDTAIQIAGKLGKSNEVALINSNDFRDGMSISAIAAAKGMPVIPVDTYSMPASVSKYLQGYKKADQIYVVGGQDKISDSVISGLPNIKRIGGGDIYSSNIGVVNAFLGELKTDTIYISSAKDFPDSLGASALAPKTTSPIIFVDSPMSYATQNFLKSHIVNNIKVLGGPGAVSYESEQIAKSLPSAIASIDNITDTIVQNEKYTPRPTMIVTASDGSKKEVNVDWNLTKINTSKPGIYTFTGTIHGTDKTVLATLRVKPIPYKIDDLTKTAVSRQFFNVPSTVEAQMTDGTKTQVPVTWDYGTQSGNKPGVYVFYGTVDNYSKKVKLTLTVTDNGTSSKVIKTINNIKKTVATKSNFTLPSTVTAIMTDNSTQSVPVTWGTENKYATGVYTYEGTVSGYSGKVGLMLIVTGEGGQDPNDPNYPDNPPDPSNPDTIDLGELAAIMQNESYPTTVKDPTTGKQVAVTWTEAVSIDSTFVDSTYIDDCRVAKFTLNGAISGNRKVKATIGIIPKIITLNVDNNTGNVPAIAITVKRSDYSGGTFNMDELSNRICAVINNADGNREAKKVHVLLWNPPVIDISDSNTYHVTATISHYSTPITVTIKVQ